MKFQQILKISAASGAIGLALASQPALAQDTQTGTVDCASDPTAAGCAATPIVVTGSISRNPAAATASPVVSVTAEDLTNRGVTTVAEAIQTLTANNQGTVPSSWSTWGFTTGATAPSLRGFNDAYTLILFDGMRSAPYPLADDAQRNITDTNTIPTGIVGRIDTLLDGASATYGSDAIAGVINIIPKREIQGLHLAGSLGIAQRGDAGEQRAAAEYGIGDLDADGWNVYAAGEWSHNDSLYVRQRGYPYNTSDQSGICGTTDQGCLYNGILNGVQYDDKLSFTSTRTPVVRPYDMPGGTAAGIYQLAAPSLGCQGLNSYTLTAAQQAANPIAPATVCQQDRNYDYSMYSPELRRLGGTLRASFRYGDSGEAYIMGNYYNVKANTNVTPYGYTGSTAAGGQTVTVNAIYLPAYVCSAGVGQVDANGNLFATGCNASNGTLNPNNPFAAQGQVARFYARTPETRQTNTKAQTYRLAAGASGSFGDSGFDYSLGATWSKVNLDITNNGYIYLQGLLDAVAQGTYNFADPSANTDAQNQILYPTNYKRATSELWQVQGTLAKDLFELPGGMLNVAIAGQYRHEAIDNPSANAPNNVNPYARYFSINAVAVTGSRNIWSAAYEITVPILDQLRIKADGSYDHYSTGQHAFSPKFEAEFKPIESVKLRGTWSKGFRAPNFNESFQLPSTGYQTAQINCKLPDGSPNPTFAAFCAAHASNPNYYSGGYSIGLTSSGNPNLKSEKSTSYTAGIVFQPRRNITFTADYWHTKIKNLISPAAVSSDIITQYYTNNGTVNDPNATVIPGIADSQNPNALPLLGFIQSSFLNADSLSGSGIDLSADAVFPIGSSLTWETKGTLAYMIKLQKVLDDGSVQRYDGTLGACGLTSCSGAPRYRAMWTNTFNWNDATKVSLTASYTSSYSTVATDSGGVYGDCQASADNGQLVTWDNGEPFACRSKAVFYLDGHVEQNIGEKFKVYMDVLNLLDTKAKYDPNAAYGIYNFNPAWSDRLFIGRYFRVGAKIDF